MRNLGKGDQICDGVVDCPDFSDELYCPYCPEHHFHCGVGKMCIPKNKMCDGHVDCDNGADEKGCCKLTPSLSKRQRKPPMGVGISRKLMVEFEGLWDLQSQNPP